MNEVKPALSSRRSPTEQPDPPPGHCDETASAASFSALIALFAGNGMRVSGAGGRAQSVDKLKGEGPPDWPKAIARMASANVNVVTVGAQEFEGVGQPGGARSRNKTSCQRASEKDSSVLAIRAAQKSNNRCKQKHR